MFESIKSFVNPDKNPDLSSAFDYHSKNLPTLWLLGKTGAGKSSLIQALTGLSSIRVGNGFEPCTKNSQAYNFPQEAPVLRFLDTRGLAEADYDPDQDIAMCVQQSHALLIVSKIDDPEQSSVISALKKIRKKRKIKHLLVVHTAVCQVSESEKNRLVAHKMKQLEEVWGESLTNVEVDFETTVGEIYQLDKLKERIVQLLPIVGLMIQNKEHADYEESNFETLKREVLWYSGSASASDLLPVVGMVSVPAVQAKMLHSLANQYGLKWDLTTLSELTSALGTSFGIQYGLKLGVRQLVKLIPGYGQTVGAASAAAVSLATTYGLGRTACYYFYHKSKGKPVNETEMQNLYKKAFSQGKTVKENG